MKPPPIKPAPTLAPDPKRPEPMPTSAPVQPRNDDWSRGVGSRDASSTTSPTEPFVWREPGKPKRR